MRLMVAAKFLILLCLTVWAGDVCYAAKSRGKVDSFREALRRGKEVERLVGNLIYHKEKVPTQFRTSNRFKELSVQEVREQKARGEREAWLELSALFRQQEKARAERKKSEVPSPSYAEEARRLKWRNAGKAGLVATLAHELCLKTIEWSEVISNAICPGWWWELLRQFIGLAVLLIIVGMASYIVLGLLVIRYEFPGKKKVYVLSGIPAVLSIVSSEIILTEAQTTVLNIVLVAFVVFSVIAAMNIPLRYLDTSKQSFLVSLLCYILFSLGLVLAVAVITAVALQLLLVAILLLIVVVIGIVGAGAAGGSEKEEEKRRIEQMNSDVRIANDGVEVFRAGQSLWRSREGVLYRGGEDGHPPYKDFAER